MPRQDRLERLPEAAFALGFTALCAVLALTFFREFVLRGGTMPFGTDMLEEAYALRRFAVEELAAGRPFPAWNPFAYSGIPFLETLPYPVFYPTSLLYFVLPLGRAIGWGFVLHFLAAGVFAFALARRLGISRWGAMLAGLAFMFNGYMVSHLYAGQDGRIFAMTLIPLVFYFLRVGLDTDRLAPFLLMGGAVALQIFTPHVQVMYFSSLAAVAYLLVETAGRWRRDGARPALANAGRFAAGFVLAALVAAVQLWPTATFLQWAVRGVESGYAYASSWALPPREISALIAPDLVGSLGTYRGANPFKLHTEYLGAIPLLLALAALLWGERRRTLFWALLGLAALLFALGAATPLHRLAYAVVPMIKSFRAPAMMLAVTAFAVAVLTGVGFDAVRARVGPSSDSRSGRRESAAAGPVGWGAPRVLVLLGLTALLALVWVLALVAPGALAGLAGARAEARAGADPFGGAAGLAAFRAGFGITLLAWIAGAAVLLWGLGRGRLRPSVAAGLLGLLLIVDLWRVDARYLDVVEIERVFAPGPAVRFLQSREPPFRILSVPGAMGPNEAVLHRLEGVWGLQKFRLGWYDTLLGGATGANLGSPAIWRLLNLRYVVTPRAVEMEGLQPLFEGPPAVHAWEGEAPRAWLAAQARVVGDREALELLTDAEFDVRRIALLAEPLDLPSGDAAAGAGVARGTQGGRVAPEKQPARVAPGTEGARAGSQEEGGDVRFLSYAPNRLEAEVRAPAPSFAVFSEAYHPYWEATLDGRPVPLVRADLALRAVAVPAGTHRVAMEYRPRAFERARLVSLAGLAAALAYAAAGWRRGPGRGLRGLVRPPRAAPGGKTPRDRTP